MIPSTFVGNWTNHYLSWKNCNTINKVIIKYEDLILNPNDVFKNIINFLVEYAKIEYNEKRLENAIQTTQFENLKKQEDKYGFPMGQKNKFFHLGKKNNWRNSVDPKIVDKINTQFNSEMKQLGYI